jgi:hypothetical protein
MNYKDRLDILRRLKQIRNHPNGILEQAYRKRLWIPGKQDTGLIGKVLENLVGPTYSGHGIPDYLLAELKTFGQGSKSDMTLMRYNSDDLLVPFQSTRLHNKIVKTVVAEHVEHETFNVNGVDWADRKLGAIFTLDVCEEFMLAHLTEDFELFRKTGSSAGAKYLYLTLYRSDSRQGGEDKFKWCLRRSALTLIQSHHGFADNELFEMGD